MKNFTLHSMKDGSLICRKRQQTDVYYKIIPVIVLLTWVHQISSVYPLTNELNNIYARTEFSINNRYTVLDEINSSRERVDLCSSLTKKFEIGNREDRINLYNESAFIGLLLKTAKLLGIVTLGIIIYFWSPKWFIHAAQIYLGLFTVRYICLNSKSESGTWLLVLDYIYPYESLWDDIAALPTGLYALIHFSKNLFITVCLFVVCFLVRVESIENIQRDIKRNGGAHDLEEEEKMGFFIHSVTFGFSTLTMTWIVGILSIRSLMVSHENSLHFYALLITSAYLINFIYFFARAVFLQARTAWIDCREDRTDFDFKHHIDTVTRYHMGTIAFASTWVMPMCVSLFHFAQNQLAVTQSVADRLDNIILASLFVPMASVKTSLILTSAYGKDYVQASRDACDLVMERSTPIFYVLARSGIHLTVLVLFAAFTGSVAHACPALDASLFEIFKLLLQSGLFFMTILYVFVQMPVLIVYESFEEAKRISSLAR